MSQGNDSPPSLQPFPKALIEACGLTEIAPQLSGMAVHIGDSQHPPFILDGSTISLRRDMTQELVTVATVLREAIELYMLGSSRWAHRIMAHSTASIYNATTLRTASTNHEHPGVIVRNLGERLLEGAYDPPELAEEIARFILIRDQLESCPSEELAAASRAFPLVAPTEVLLTHGGDHRQEVDWTTGLNSYGISPRPTLWTAQYGSCTASAPSERAFVAAQRLRHELAAAALDDRLASVSAEKSEEIRGLVSSAIGLTVEDDADIVLTPSGTDAEIVALSLAVGDLDQITTIVVAPTEIGSGSLDAAMGRHFSPLSPLGRQVQVGQPIRGLEDRRIDLLTVDVRDEKGLLRSPDEIDGDVDRLLEGIDGQVLLHVVEGSKTGVRAPSDSALVIWEERYGPRLNVVVDAAQMRVDQRTVANHYKNDRMVFLTGSKFFGGPPFSGALLVPPVLAERAMKGHRVPSGLADYVSRYDLPERLQALHLQANPKPNLALLLRWEAALAEIRAFHNASPEIRDEVMRDLVAGIRAIVDASDRVEIIESPYTPIPGDDHRGLDDLPTIFTFVVLDQAGDELDLAATKRLQRLLSTDLTSNLPGSKDGDSRRLARQTFHLGQPVPIARGPDLIAGGLRIAIGAPTLYQIIFDHTRGLSWTARIERELNDIQGAFDKISLILERMSPLLSG